MDDIVWPALPQCHVQGIQHQLCAQMIGHRPAHHPPRAHVENDREEQKACPGRYVSDVSYVQLIGPIGCEVARNEIRCRTRAFTALRGTNPFSTTHALKLRRSHQPGDALSANPPTPLLKLSMNARRTVSTAGILMNLPDTLGEHRITDTALRSRSRPPSIIAAGGDTQHTA